MSSNNLSSLKFLVCLIISTFFLLLKYLIASISIIRIRREPNIEIKAILVGRSGVGKTNLIRVSMGKPFDKNENSTISSSYYENDIVVKDKKYLYCLWDTAGQEVYRSLNKIFIKESKIIIIVFAINSKESFEQIDFWLNYTKDILGSDNYIFGLVGNKSDLYEEQSISDQEIKQKADELQIKYKITSAATDSIGFKEFLDELLAEYINKYSPQEIDKPKSFKISEDKDEGDNKDKNGKGKKNCC
jgi:small GTP-binding protein